MSSSAASPPSSDRPDSPAPDGLPHVGVDVGGTFTDVALLGPDGRLTTAKVLTTNDQSEGVMAGLGKACRQADLALEDLARFTHSTTVAVNALLEETGARTALVTTAGFRDVLEIGRQDRPALYDPAARRPEPLVPRRLRFEIAERSDTDAVRRAVDENAVRALAERIEDRDVESVAVCLLHAYVRPENERAVARVLRDRLDVPVSVSHELLPEFREYERTSTTVADAYLSPVVGRYLAGLRDRTRAASVPAPLVMQANGGTAELEEVLDRPVTTLMSGPAAGGVGAKAVVARAGDSQPSVVTFDMGGTSTDVSLAGPDGVALTTDARVNGRPVRTPMVDVHTVGAGGGSVAWVDDGGALRVGPRSAGAEPGPACYGKGGREPTVTDANLVLGYLGATTRLGGEMTLDGEAAREVLGRLAGEAGLDGPVEAARGVYRVANARMSRAVRAVTVERGHDPRTSVLAAFGGAGPMHGAALAEELGVEEVLVPRSCGVLSAFGLLAADERQDRVQTLRSPVREADTDRVAAIYDRMESEARERLSAPEEARIERTADLRYRGQSFELNVAVSAPVDREALEEAFHAAHRRAYEYAMDDPVELVNLRLHARRPAPVPRPRFAGGSGTPGGRREAFFEGRFAPAPVYDWKALRPDQRLSGAAIVERAESTVVIPPAWTARVRKDGALHLRHS